MNKLGLIVAIIVGMSVVACSDRPSCQSFRTTVVKVFDETCTMQSKDPKCRVELSNGIRLNVDAPIMKDDVLFGCTYESYTRLWRIETPSKIGLSTIGVYDN